MMEPRKLEDFLDLKNAKHYNMDNDSFVLNSSNFCANGFKSEKVIQRKSASDLRADLLQVLSSNQKIRHKEIGDCLLLLHKKTDINDLYLVLLRCLAIIFPVILGIFLTIELVTGDFSIGIKSILSLIALVLLTHFNISYTKSKHWYNYLVRHLEAIQNNTT